MKNNTDKYIELKEATAVPMAEFISNAKKRKYSKSCIILVSEQHIIELDQHIMKSQDSIAEAKKEYKEQPDGLVLYACNDHFASLEEYLKTERKSIDINKWDIEELERIKREVLQK